MNEASLTDVRNVSCIRRFDVFPAKTSEMVLSLLIDKKS